MVSKGIPGVFREGVLKERDEFSGSHIEPRRLLLLTQGGKNKGGVRRGR